MNDALRLVVLLIVGAASLAAFFAVLSVLFPRRIDKTYAVATTLTGRALLVGVVNFLFFGSTALVLLALSERIGSGLLRGLLVLPGLFLVALLAIGLSFGLAAMVQLVGERLFPQGTGLMRTIWGTLALSLACLLPFLGWLGLFPYVGLLGLGAFITSFFYRERPSPPTAAKAES